MILLPAGMGLVASHDGVAALPQYFDPLNAASEIALSGSNATATRTTTNDGSWRSVRSVTAHNSGKWYAEGVDVANGSTSGAMIFGVCKAAASLSSYPGSDSNSWGNQANNPAVFFYLAGIANDVSASFATIGAGGYAKIAIDFAAGKGWFGTSATGSGGWGVGNDPATGAGGSFTFTASTTLYLLLGEQHSPQQCTLRTATADMAGTIPAGFSAWG